MKDTPAPRRFEFKITGMDCAEEVDILKRELAPLAGGQDCVTCNLLASKLIVAPRNTDVTSEEIRRRVRTTGMEAVDWAEHVARTVPRAESFWEKRGRAILCASSGLLLCAGFVAHGFARGFAAAVGEGAIPPILPILLYSAAMITGGWYVAPRALVSARHLRPDIHLLMTVAVIGAIILGVWSEAATVTFLFALALLLEAWSVGRARHAIGALLDLSPPKARVICPHDGDIEEKPIEDVPLGAAVVVLPGERIPLDGVVTNGTTSVNQAPITGESVPVAKGPGDEVFAGTINQEGSIEFRVTHRADDTTLARIIRMVEEAQARRSPSERWVEQFARYYTPAMMALALAMAVIPPVVIGGGWARWLYQALVILVIACPCALVISTPVTIVAALASAARAGVLIKGGLYVEIPARLKILAIDKTGTLTFGRPEIQRIIPLNGHTEYELLERAAAVESLSEHPLAGAILRKAHEQGVEFDRATSYQAVRGKGAEATIGNRRFWIGSHRYVHEIGMETPVAHEQALALEDEGHSVVFIGNDEHVCGLITVADNVRPHAAEAVASVRKAGIQRLVMLTGDNEGTARAIAEATGIKVYQAELLPQDKVEAVRSLLRMHRHVGMVGDGVNDAPAMAAATLGIAMGAAGSDAAIETADIALMSDDLTKLAWLMHHSRRAVRIIKQNVAFAIGLKALFIGLALAGLATLWMAIAADMGASLLVIFNGLRMLGGKGAGRV